MHQHRDRIAATGATAVFVAFDEAERLRSTMLAEVELAYPVAVDPDRSTYRAWGLRRAAWREIWLDPRVWWRYARLIIGGERLRSSGEDSLQLGGDFVVAPDRTIAYSRPQVRDDRPPVAELIAAAADLA